MQAILILAHRVKLANMELNKEFELVYGMFYRCGSTSDHSF